MLRPILPALLILHIIGGINSYTEGSQRDYKSRDVKYDIQDYDQQIPVIDMNLNPAKWDLVHENYKNQYYPDELLNLENILEELSKTKYLKKHEDNIKLPQTSVFRDLSEPGNLQFVNHKTSEPITAQKKGQNEFVEFVEPKSANRLHHISTIEKRIAADFSSQKTSRLILTGNFLFIAVATVCLVGAVASAIGGSYYYQKVRAKQLAAERSDFSYVPTGPGRDKKKRKGDESLAYKAQLHHYQQTKQKIISGDEPVVEIDNETSEASEDEEGMSNFSVYECPGLAPTGDIEVQNPNFDSRS